MDDLPVHPLSAICIATIGPDDHLPPDFGSGLWEGEPIGIPYVVVPGSQPGVQMTFEYDEESDHALYPIPENPPIEGGPHSTGDRHILILDRDGCRLYELYAAYPQGDGTWHAGSGAIYDLGSNALRPAGWTSADAAGLPILPGLVRYDEVQAGAIEHALRFTVSRTRRTYVWPARHYASYSDDARLPPMGLCVRLKAEFDISAYPPEIRVMLLALKRYGMLLADNGGDWFISGVPDERWDNDMLVGAFHSIKGSDLEVVDVSSLMVDRDSGQVRQGTRWLHLPLIWRQMIP